MIGEITAQQLNPESFIGQKIEEIRAVVAEGAAINALSGGVDSSAVTMLGLTRSGETAPVRVRRERPHAGGESRARAGAVPRSPVSPSRWSTRARSSSAALKGITDPEEKREAITQTSYKKVFGRLVKESKARHLLQGTILTDVDDGGRDQTPAQRFRRARHRSRRRLSATGRF